MTGIPASFCQKSLDLDFVVLNQLIQQFLGMIGRVITQMNAIHGDRRHIVEIRATFVTVHIDRQFHRDRSVIILFDIFELEISSADQVRCATGELVRSGQLLSYGRWYSLRL